MIILSASGIGVHFGAKEVLRDISFSVAERDRVGIIGVNGVGKTTLLKVISDDIDPDSGTVALGKGVSVGMLHQMTDLSHMGDLTLLRYMELAFPELLAMEQELEDTERAMTRAGREGNTALAASLSGKYDSLSATFTAEGGQVFRGKCRSMLVRLGFEDALSRTISEISGGQHTRLALARLLAREPDILLLDEPTNHLDIDALTWLEDYLASYPKTVMVVSHDRYFLDKVTTKTLHISYTRATLYQGNYTEAKNKREQDQASLEKKKREQDKIRRRIEANIAFQRRCGQEHNFVTIRSKQKQLDRMEKIELAKAEKNIRMRFSAEEESAANVLTVRGLSFSYGHAPLIEKISFAIRRGERVLLLGGNGTGKSTLLKLLCGSLTPASGYIDYGDRVTVGYYDQEMKGLHPSNTVFEELHSTFPQMTHLEIRSALALFLFGPDDITQTIGSLSGGERARVLLCKLMLQKVNVLVLDEPTNHLDIASREALEEALSDFDGTVIAVSHDRYFIDRTASRLLILSPDAEGGLVDFPLEELDGAYTAYTKLRAQMTEEKKPAAPAETDAKRQYEEQKKARSEARGLIKRREQMQKRADALEAELSQIEAEMQKPEVATDYVKTAALYERREAAEAELLELYEALME